ncbi:MAG: hypothetical protein ACRBCJ_11585 [Hyphomicrobiaceae bacterium]
MTRITVWMVTFVVSLAVLLFMAADTQPIIHMITAGVAGLIFAILAIIDESKRRKGGASETLVSAYNARNMGLVWIWGAVGLLITYLFFLHWHEWLTFFLVFAGVGAMCLVFSNMLMRDANSDTADDTITKLARYMAVAQLVGMIITMVGLIIDGKMVRYQNIRAGWEDWAANNIFFFGAMALAIISANALYHSRKSGDSASAS